jgi:hypothetical protein
VIALHKYATQMPIIPTLPLERAPREAPEKIRFLFSAYLISKNSKLKKMHFSSTILN